jgi:hypothetical protein
MNKSVFIAIISIAIMSLFSACDSHNWEDDPEKGPGSKHLFQTHSSADANEAEGGKAHN